MLLALSAVRRGRGSADDRQLFDGTEGAGSGDCAVCADGRAPMRKAQKPDGTTPLHYAAHFGETRGWSKRC